MYYDLQIPSNTCTHCYKGTAHAILAGVGFYAMMPTVISYSRRCASLVLVLLTGLPLLLSAKPIRLRNEIIEPPPAAGQRMAAPGVNITQSGLFLVQFTNPPTATDREQLALQGIELLRYVPEDAYIARVRNVTTRKLASATGVHFVTPYLPIHKLDARIKSAAQANAAGAQTVRVCIVLAPGIDASANLGVRRLLSRIHQDNPLRLTPVLRAEIQPSRLEALANSPAVLWIELDRPMRMHDEVSSKIVDGDGGPNQTLMQSLGFDGRGVAVAVADSGLDGGDASSMHPDLFGRTPAFFYYGSLTDASDEHSHGTHVAGIIGGNGATGEKDDNGALYGLGVAPGAAIIAQRIFDGAGNYEAPPSYEKLTRDATQAGAVIGSNSWGDDTQGRYDVSAAEFDELVRDADSTRAGDQPYILEFSAGNAGPGAQTMDSPAVAKNVIATGACQSDRRDLFIYDTGPDTMADFSSRGPAEDGRIKPDIVAPGTWISSLQSSSATDENAWSPIDQYYQYQGGTSQAGPHAAGAAAVFVQHYRETHTNATPSPALVKAALINSATALDPTVEVGPAPNGDEGWGRVDLAELIGSSRRFDFVDQSVLLVNNQVWEHRIVVGGGSQPLKITLAYTDVPGLPAAIPALVNDLDLEVISPDGVLYRGNQFLDGESMPDAPAPDSINNVEGIFIAQPALGEYVVRVRAHKIVEDARRDTQVIDQDFALVTSGDLPLPGQGVIVLNRGAYTAPSQMRIRLFDYDLAGLSNVTVKVRSTTETNAESVVLQAATSTGSFTGAVLTVTGPAARDGQLQIANGDTIEVSYFDASSATDRIAAARADLIAPVLSNVAVTNEFGDMLITWSTDEPCTSTLLYSTNNTLSLTAVDSSLTTDHQITLRGLAANQQYNFVVISSDEAGNTTTNNNGGRYFSFTPVAASPVLLVDAANDTLFGMAPLSGYTDPLDQLGVSYSLWAADQLGVPSLAVLRNHRSVICRLPEIGSPLNASQLVGLCNNLAAYVSQGGSLFIATMDGLNRLEEAGASSFITNTLHVQSHMVDLGVTQIISAGDSVGSTMNAALDYSAYESAWSDLIAFGLMTSADISDTITPTRDAVPVLVDEFGDTVGLRWPKTGQASPGRVVFFSFPFDGVPAGTSLVNNRAKLLHNILAFLIPGMNGLGTIALDGPAYTVPARVVIEVDDSDLAGLGSVTVTAFSPRKTNGIPVTLTPLNTNGSFTGWFALIAATNTPGPAQLPAGDGDTIQVDYQDASSHGTVSATGIIDTQAPVTSGVTAVADYQNVTISWSTSEPADGLAQMGTSVLLDHSEYDPAVSTLHEVAVSGLEPDTEYLFRVTSTDVAGNTRIDDNQGRFYKVRTLTPLTSPWSDNFDTGATNWTTFDGDMSQAHWTLGVPNNSLATSAHSPPNAWGSNLDGAGIDEADTFLISPAIHLTNGNTATLRFWHHYDFTEKTGEDILEQGIVYVLTNSIGNYSTIAAYGGDATLDWEEQEIDLTPFMGQVVYVVWEYQMLSLSGAQRPGWLVDDVSITVSNSSGGTLVITNNLSQATWNLAGPLSTNSGGLSAIISNTPPGDYTIRWGTVADYVAPASQTNTLIAGGKLTFEGHYSIIDTNSNGIPDSWEQRYLGSVSANHPANSDSDGDGMSDYAEFIAGTNPTNAASVFELSATSATSGHKDAELTWTLAPNHSYRVLGSVDLTNWPAVSPWLYNTNRFPIAYPTNGAPYLFRVEVRP